jgi:cell division protein ZapA (FtsZ GTPase activity inhibitor)
MKIEVLGTTFTVQSDQDPAYLREIIDYYKLKVGEVQRSVSTHDSLKTAILAALLIVDEYFKFRASPQTLNPQESLEADRIARELILSLDQAMAGKSNQKAKSN